MAMFRPVYEGDRAAQLPRNGGEQAAQLVVHMYVVRMWPVLQQRAVYVEKQGNVPAFQIVGRWRRYPHAARTPSPATFSPAGVAEGARLRMRAASSSIEPAQRKTLFVLTVSRSRRMRSRASSAEHGERLEEDFAHAGCVERIHQQRLGKFPRARRRRWRAPARPARRRVRRRIPWRPGSCRHAGWRRRRGRRPDRARRAPTGRDARRARGPAGSRRGRSAR